MAPNPEEKVEGAGASEAGASGVPAESPAETPALTAVQQAEQAELQRRQVGTQQKAVKGPRCVFSAVKGGLCTEQARWRYLKDKSILACDRHKSADYEALL